MNKLLLTCCFILFSIVAWTQTDSKQQFAVTTLQTPLPDSLELMIESEFGWNLCAGGQLELYTNYISDNYQWLRNDTLLAHNSAQMTVAEAGVYQIRVLTDDSLLYSNVAEVVLHQPRVPVITYANNVLTASEAVAYQWYRSDEILEAATDQNLYLLESGDYYVETTDENGCVASSEVLSLNVANIHEVNLKSIDTYPSPTRAKLFVQPVNIENQDFTLSLIAQNGKLLQRVEGRLRDNRKIELDLESLPTGTYFLQFLGEQVQLIEQVVKY